MWHHDPARMPKKNKVDVTIGSMPVRVLSAGEYPAEITAASGARRPDVRFAAVHPLGLYHVDHLGAGHLQAYFTPRRRGSRAKPIGGASSMRGAFARIIAHEDELVDPGAPREEGRGGPVNIFSLGRRLDEGTAVRAAKTPTQLEREIAQILAESGA